jgi:hypothetical protein
MYNTIAAGGYPLDSSVAGGPQLELTTPRLRWRRSARRLDTMGTLITPLVPGPFKRARRRQDDRRDFATDKRRRHTDRSLAWVARPARATERERPPPSQIDGYTSTATQLTHTLLPSRGSWASLNPTAGTDGPRPASGSQPDHRATDPAQRHPGPHLLPSPGGSVTHHRWLDPGPPRLISGQQDHGLRRDATSPGATATRNTPVAQSEEVAT